MTWYNVHNCKSGRNKRRHTFESHNTQYKPSLNKIPYYDLKVKEKKDRKTKTPSPCQQNRMPHALNLFQVTNKNHLSMDSLYGKHSCIIPPYCQGPNQDDSSIDLQDEVILIKVITQLTRKPRSVGQHKVIPKKSRNKRKKCLEK